MLTVLENNIIGYKIAQKAELKIESWNIDNFFHVEKTGSADSIPRV
jgi:hypothetical protein